MGQASQYSEFSERHRSFISRPPRYVTKPSSNRTKLDVHPEFSEINMKRLYLLRHAKSGWDSPEKDDFDRPLSLRGRRSAPLMGRYMRDLGYMPSIALCSPARRTQETWDMVRDVLDSGTTEEMRPDLYHPDPRTLLVAVQSVDDAHASAIVISHNPGIRTLALGLIGSGVVSANPFGKYPTAALTVFDFAVDAWKNVYPGQGRLIGFTRLKELDSAA